MTPTIHVLSHIGNSRDNQEDNFIAGKGRILSVTDRDQMAADRMPYAVKTKLKGDYCVAVSDGMGGYEGGEIASFDTVSFISENYEWLIKESKNNRLFIKTFIARLNSFVADKAQKVQEVKHMGATLCGLLSVGGAVMCFNVGDSRMYMLEDGAIRQVTIDNTEGQRLLGLGLLTEEELSEFPKRKAIYKYIGKSVELVPDVYELGTMKRGTVLLICSDGLSDVVEEHELEAVLSAKGLTIQEKAQNLLDKALEREQGSGDNITLMIIDY